MGRYSSIPDLFDECHTIDLSSLKSWGYLKPRQTLNGTIRWSRNGFQTGYIDIGVNTLSENYHLTLSYNYRNKPVLYRVNLVSVPSNLGKGKVYYFLCPLTGKRCRKLFRMGAKFLHREAHPFAMYETQTYSPKNRHLVRQLDKKLCSEKAFEQMHSKHFKTHYAGKPTKRYKKLLQKIEEARGISITELLCS